MKASFLTRHPVVKDLVNISIFVVCVVVGAVIINTYIFRSFSVVGPSMESTLYTGDRLIVNRIPVTIAHLKNQNYTPNRGQVIVFKNPRYASGIGDEYIVKRVIAFSGERVVLKDGIFTIYNSGHPDGFNPDDDTNINDEIIGPTSGTYDDIVPEGELFVSGDHRVDSYSYDSRNGLGTIPLYDVVGPVFVRVFPFNQIRFF